MANAHINRKPGGAHQILRELQEADLGLRAWTCWVLNRTHLGQWVPVKEILSRALVYQTFQHLLEKGDQMNDQVVRVTDGRQLGSVVDDSFGLAVEPFVP